MRQTMQLQRLLTILENECLFNYCKDLPLSIWWVIYVILGLVILTMDKTRVKIKKRVFRIIYEVLYLVLFLIYCYSIIIGPVQTWKMGNTMIPVFIDILVNTVFITLIIKNITIFYFI